VPVERGLNLREYQKELAETAILGQNTIIHAATGAGKTRIAFYIVKNHLDKNPQGMYI
jgi:ERCC4-related helicase